MGAWRACSGELSGLLAPFSEHRAGSAALKFRNRFRIFKARARVLEVFVRKIERLLNDQASGLKRYRVAGSRGRAGHCSPMSQRDSHHKSRGCEGTSYPGLPRL